MKSKILIIEDDRIMRENTAELLELSGYEVSTAVDGKTGVEKVSNFHPDLIICDIMMPELDGFGVLYILSKEAETAAIPFIFLTAKSEMVDLRKGMNLGADDYLTKPFDDMDLLNAVDSRLKKYQALKKDFSDGEEGLQNFLSEARNLNAINSLRDDRKKYTYEPKEYIFREGDHANFLFYISSGKVKTFKLNEDVKEYIIDTYEKGDYLGYQPILEDRNYAEFASPISKVEVIKIPKQDFLDLLYNNREVASKFIKMMSKNLSEREEQLLHLAYDSVKKRIAAQLLHLFDESGQDKIELSRSDLANMIGTSKETLVRGLSSLKEEGILETDGQEIMLKNKEMLQQVLKWS